jgi:hypothetical protein
MPSTNQHLDVQSVLIAKKCQVWKRHCYTWNKYHILLVFVAAVSKQYFIYGIGWTGLKSLVLFMGNGIHFDIYEVVVYYISV